jgi:hypothetical protein
MLACTYQFGRVIFMAGVTQSLLVKAVDESLEKIHELLPEDKKYLVVDLGKRIGAMATEKYQEGRKDEMLEIMDAHNS